MIMSSGSRVLVLSPVSVCSLSESLQNLLWAQRGVQSDDFVSGSGTLEAAGERR